MNEKFIDRRDFCKGGLGFTAMAALSALGVSPVSAATFAEEDLIYMPASLQLELFRRKMLSPVDVLKAQIERIEAKGKKVNAITYTHFDEAMKAAKVSEQRYMKGSARVLEGITVGMKDEHGKRGWIVTQGSKLLKESKLKKNDPITDKLLEAGAILPIQTTVPEFYLHGCTWTELWGVTRNPWNLNFSVGGSSGGSGAALAAGFCTLATGSDMGGSIRIPCAFDGLYGFKPPYGRVASVEPLLLIATSGPMARTFLDTVLMQNAISGPHPDSLTTIRPKLEMPLHYSGLKGMRIAYTPNQGWAEIDADTAKNTDAAVKLLRDLGAVVDEVELDIGLTMEQMSDAFANSALSGPMGEVLASMKGDIDKLTTYARYFVEKAVKGKYGSKQAKAYETTIKDLNARMQEQVFLKGYRAIIMPTLATSHIPADYDYTKGDLKINGKSVHPLTGWILTLLFNLLNWYPVVAAPTGLSSKRVPTGMQIAAQSYDDLTTFRVAANYAKAAPALYTGKLFPDFRNG